MTVTKQRNDVSENSQQFLSIVKIESGVFTLNCRKIFRRLICTHHDDAATVGLVWAKRSVRVGGGVDGSTEGGGRRREALGSRPPRCVNKCSSCSPCTATLVVSPHGRGPTAVSPARAAEDGSNYYLLAWKCACGNKLFQP
ncbi:EPIDERMAL PATTERNING FACTOR-like protein 6 [Ananas comosus]|uniref:Epidermal patterning factor-like protein n=1 Tax=Ananas comosus TaxID=4615 RepID=A0A199VRA4_ANACO|nr:EPIDERMAL PATTERNING FACTOR-like protein 6 [Ananas comosus]